MILKYIWKPTPVNIKNVFIHMQLMLPTVTPANIIHRFNFKIMNQEESVKKNYKGNEKS